MNRWLLLAALGFLGCSDDSATGAAADDLTNNSNGTTNNSNNSNNLSENNSNNSNNSSTNNSNNSTNNLTTSNNAVEDVGLADMGADTGVEEDAGMDVSPVQEDVYVPGALTVVRLDIPTGNNGPEVPLVVHHPVTDGVYPVVVLQHGFSLRNTAYNDMASHVASHGYVVVAPQMYEPSLFGSPSTTEEAEAAEALYDWLKVNLDARVPVTADMENFGLAGHSRGGKAAWIVLKGGYAGVDAIAGIDPVDGTGGPLGGEARVTEGGFGFSLPTLVIGTGLGPQTVLGQACAPAGDNHEQFYGAAQSPAYHVVAPDYGHLDMVACGVLCNTCKAGPDGKFKPVVAGLLVAFFDGSLKGDVGSYGLLGAQAPVTLQYESK